MDVRLTWTDCDEAGDYVVPNVLSTTDLVSRPDNMDGTVLHTNTNRAVQPHKMARGLEDSLGPFGKFVAWHHNSTMR